LTTEKVLTGLTFQKSLPQWLFISKRKIIIISEVTMIFFYLSQVFRICLFENVKVFNRIQLFLGLSIANTISATVL
jgi:hypothetical protein